MANNIDEEFRQEVDAIGSVRLDKDALFGIQTLRGLENFPLTGRSLGKQREFVRALAQCKWAAAMANHELGVLSLQQRDALVQACEELADGQHDHHLLVDLLEGSGGTSTNMNVNEVLANRAQLLLGGQLGTYDLVHPNDHVNRSQSTNDVYPAALKLAVYAMLSGLITELQLLAESCYQKKIQYADILHLGRTCMQDAQPMQLGQKFGGYGALVTRLAESLEEVRQKLTVLPLGGTAIGTGFGSVAGYKEAVYRYLAQITGTRFTPADDPFDAMQNLDAFARISSELRTAAASIAKIANDLIILSSGPVGGLAEIRLPAVQAGSSIMPGKVNPVLPMSMCQISYALAGNDVCIGQAVLGGQLEINHYEPVIADRLFESIGLLERGLKVFRERCVDGIDADAAQNEKHVMESTAIATALVPQLGYRMVSQLVRRSQEEQSTLIAVMAQENIMSVAEATDLARKAAQVVV